MNQQSLNISGPYIGTYTASELPGETFHIICIFNQTDTVIEGLYYTSSGVYGIGHGTLTGNEATMSWLNTTPNCRGVYKGTYIFEGDTVTWEYAGYDCEGPETGTGQATRIADF